VQIVGTLLIRQGVGTGQQAIVQQSQAATTTCVAFAPMRINADQITEYLWA